MVVLIRHHPKYSPSFSTNIADDKDSTLELANDTFATTPAMVYCDGLGYQDGIRASAVLYIKGVETQHLCYHLSSKTEHTVYKAEIHKLPALAVIGSDSQAMIKAFLNQHPHPAHYLLNIVHTASEQLHIKQDCFI
ncbi:hypothetical protein E4T56_gene10353 [Termitomyces sp. T112]|nr:hypothetical protein E4T56_gene10353 [Termitomyces sp. T112]